jgi:uncharacterized membrane protein YhaH (DUF805 family)
MNYFLRGLRQYSIFAGRASRKEYWMFILVYLIIAVLIEVLEIVLMTFGGGKIWYLLISDLYYLAMLYPLLTAGVRRLHDIGRQGRWMLLLLVPLLGWVWLIDLFCRDSEVFENSYGPFPGA